MGQRSVWDTAIAVVAVGVLACGGGPPAESAATIEADLPEVQRFALHDTISLEAGELLVGAPDATSEEVALVLRSEGGELVLFACDELRAETGEAGFAIGRVQYAQAGDLERVGGMVPRAALSRLAHGSAPRLQTCDEEITLRPLEIELLQAFLDGRPGDREEFATRAVSLVGLDLSFGISNRAPDDVRVELHVDETTARGCHFDVLLESGLHRLASLEYRPPRGDSGRRRDHHVASLSRSQLALAFAGDQAGLMVCDQIWELDGALLRNVRSLLGAPSGRASLPEPRPLPEEAALSARR